MQQQLFDLGTASETAVTTARQAVLNAQSSYISAKADWETYSVEEEIASLAAKVLRAEETLESLIEQQDGAEVTASITGIVSGMDLSIGDDVQTGTTLAEVTDTENLTVEASVSEYEIGKLSIGQKLEVAPIADDEDISIATITYISPKGTISNSDTTFEIEAVVEEKSSGLLANATVNLDILVAQAKDVLAVPYEALISNGSRSMVMMQQGEEFMPIPVEQGVKGDLYVEISSPELSVGSVIQIPSTSVANFQRTPGMMPGTGGGSGAGRNAGN
jgi:HlyD family secretion protein